MNRCLPFIVLSLLGSTLWAQTNLGLSEPPQSFVFHVEGSEHLEATATAILSQFSDLEKVLPCNTGGYLVLLPKQILSQEASQTLIEGVSQFLQSQNLTSYYKPQASVVELAHNCEQLIKPLLNQQ